MGKRGRDLHKWFYPTQTFRSMTGQDGGTDDRSPARQRKASAPSSSAAICAGPPGDDWGGPEQLGEPEGQTNRPRSYVLAAFGTSRGKAVGSRAASLPTCEDRLPLMFPIEHSPTSGLFERASGFRVQVLPGSQLKKVADPLGRGGVGGRIEH
jgi:hypothetical protein